MKYFASICSFTLLITGCTNEARNTIGREVQNWTGTNGVLDIYAGDKLVNRFIKIDKLTTAHGTVDPNDEFNFISPIFDNYVDRDVLYSHVPTKLDFLEIRAY